MRKLMMLVVVVLACVVTTQTRAESKWVDWTPSTFKMAINEGCGAYECRLAINGQDYCFDEGQIYPTECCEFICDCDPDSYGLDCGWDMW